MEAPAKAMARGKDSRRGIDFFSNSMEAQKNAFFASGEEFQDAPEEGKRVARYGKKKARFRDFGSRVIPPRLFFL